MDTPTTIALVAAVASAIATAINAFMAIETRRMARVAERNLELEHLPIFGFRDLKIEMLPASNSSMAAPRLGGLNLGFELFNAGRVPLTYSVRKLEVTFRGRTLAPSNYHGRLDIAVTPGSSTYFWHAAVGITPPVDVFPNQARIQFEAEYRSEFSADVKTLRLTINCPIVTLPDGSEFRTRWFYADDGP